MTDYKQVDTVTLPQTGFLRLPEVLKFIPVSPTTWWNGVKSGRFPPSVKLGPNMTAWRAEDIREYIAKFNTQLDALILTHQQKV